MICAQKTQSSMAKENDMAKRQNYKWVIVNDKILRVIVESRLDNRCLCKTESNDEFVLSKYDVYDTLHEATAALAEGLPS